MSKKLTILFMFVAMIFIGCDSGGDDSNPEAAEADVEEGFEALRGSCVVSKSNCSI